MPESQLQQHLATPAQQHANEKNDTSADRDGPLIDARVVFLTHYIPLYQVRVLQTLAASIRHFHVLVSTPIEPNRQFTPDWSGLNVTVQNSLTVRRRWRHRAGGFDDPLYVHIPYDTAGQLRSLQPDVVMSLELGARSAGAAHYCRRNPDTKLVLCTYMSERTEQGRGWLRHCLRRKLIGSADAITFNGPSCKKYLQTFDVDEKRLFHLPYAADDRTVYQGPLQRDDPTTRHRLLVIGQLSQRKGTTPLLEQVSEYGRQKPNRSIEIVFAGDGPTRSVAESHPLPKNVSVKLLGNVSPEELAQWMPRCGCLIAPTLADEWMLAVNEGLHAGLPVIGSIHAQAVTSLINPGFNGWHYDPLVDGSLRSALDAYFGEPTDVVNCMREQARQSVADRTPAWAAAGALDAVRYVLEAAS